MPHQDGSFIRGTHTTLSNLADNVVKILKKVEGVKGVSPGFLQMGNGSAGGSLQRVKIGKFEGGLILTVHQSRSVQELRVFVDGQIKGESVMTRIARALRNNKIAIRFGPN